MAARELFWPFSEALNSQIYAIIILFIILYFNQSICSLLCLCILQVLTAGVETYSVVFTGTLMSITAPLTIKLMLLRKSGKKTRSSSVQKLQRSKTGLMDNSRSFSPSTILPLYPTLHSGPLNNTSTDPWIIHTTQEYFFWQIYVFVFTLSLLFCVKMLQKSRFIQLYYILIFND